MQTENAACCICGEGVSAKAVFAKTSGRGELFNLVRCTGCGLRYVSPRPPESAMAAYYGKEYFTARTDRGYDDYFSQRLKTEIERVFLLNLSDLDFFNFEVSLKSDKRALDIGCAAGYFVDFLKKRGWDSAGIDVSEECVMAASSAGLNVSLGDYLKASFGKSFDFITLWASIEHLHHPELFLQKARRELRPGGRLYISTCRAGSFFMMVKGRRWRYYNFPEHLYYFTYKQLASLLVSCGFTIERYSTYGSGFGRQGGLLRRCGDFCAKHFGMGDMMLISAL